MELVGPAEIYKLYRVGEVRWYTELSKADLEHEIKMAGAMGEDYHVVYYWIVPRIETT